MMLCMYDTHLGARNHIHRDAAGIIRRLLSLGDAVAAQAHELREGVLELALQPRTPAGMCNNIPRNSSASASACLEPT